MAQERLSGLSVISINSKVGQAISYNDVINDFASRKARKERFWGQLHCIETVGNIFTTIDCWTLAFMLLTYQFCYYDFFECFETVWF